MYNYSKTNAVFLDVKMFKFKVDTLHTSVFENKIPMRISILNFHPSCHPITLKKGISFSQEKQYGRIMLDSDF